MNTDEETNLAKMNIVVQEEPAELEVRPQQMPEQAENRLAELQAAC